MASCMNKSLPSQAKMDNDVEVDAEPEGNQHTKCTSQEEISQGKVNQVRDRMPSPSDEYKEYLYLFSEHKEENIDILILSDENDDVTPFKKYIKGTVSFTIGKEMLKPRVKIFRDIPDYSPNNLGRAFKRSLYVFIFITENYCESLHNQAESRACLKRSLDDKDKTGCIIPVHAIPTEILKTKNNKYLMLLDSIDPLIYPSKKFPQQITRLLETKSDVIHTRDYDLHIRRSEYFKIHGNSIMKQHQSLNLMSSSRHSCSVEKAVKQRKSSSCENSDQTDNLTNVLEKMGVAVSINVFQQQIRPDQQSPLCDKMFTTVQPNVRQRYLEGEQPMADTIFNTAHQDQSQASEDTVAEWDQKNISAVGFAECVSSVSNREPGEGSEKAYYSDLT